MERTAKDAVIWALLKEQKLSLRKINKKVSDGYDPKFSYNSIYKAIKQLQNDDVILLKENKFAISEKWAESKLKFSKSLKNHLNSIKGLTYDLDNPMVFEFNNIKETHKFLRKVEDEHLQKFSKEKKGNVIWVVYHCYNYLLQPAKELSYIKKIQENNINFKVLCYGDTALDNWTRDAFEKLGARMITGSNVGGLTGLNIYDDMVIQIFYGKEFLKVMNETYSNTKEMSAFSVAEFFENLQDIEYKVNVAIYKEKNIIKCLKERALSFFN